MASTFEDAVSRELTLAGLDFRRDVGLGGASADFVLQTPKGHVIAIDAKEWVPTRRNLQRAREQTNYLTGSLGADRAFVVMKDVSRTAPDKGVVRKEDLRETILELLEEMESRPRRRKKSTVQTDADIVFAAMPFQPRFEDVYWVAMTFAAKRVEATCERLDESDFSGDAVARIKASIGASVDVIADLSGANPNVLYEVGYAHALKKPTVHISCESSSKLPFDVSTWNTLPYEHGQT